MSPSTIQLTIRNPHLFHIPFVEKLLKRLTEFGVPLWRNSMQTLRVDGTILLHCAQSAEEANIFIIEITGHAGTCRRYLTSRFVTQNVFPQNTCAQRVHGHPGFGEDILKRSAKS